MDDDDDDDDDDGQGQSLLGLTTGKKPQNFVFEAAS